MPRVKWTCPGCSQVFTVPDATGLVLCPECRVEREIKPLRRRKSRWTTSDIAFVIISAIVLLGGSVLLGNAFWRKIPTTDPEKILVEKWLKEHLDDGKWDEVKWWPAQTPQNLYDLNMLHIIEGMEKEKDSFEKGLGNEENNVEYQKHYYKFRETGFRTFCAMKFRVTTLNGQGKTLRSQVFEIIKGEAKPLGSNDIVEVPSSPFKRPVHTSRVAYDGLKFFEDRDYDPFPVVSENLEERAQAAMIWKARAKLPSPVEPQRQQTQSQDKPSVVAANSLSIISQKPEANATEVIPLKIREYFDRATEAKSTEVKKLEKRISDFESRMRAMKKIIEKAALKERIQQTEDAIAELKRSNVSAFLPDKPEVGDIGLFQVVEVMDVVDDETLIIRWHPNGKGRLPRLDVVIYPIETKEINVGDATMKADFFKVTATRDEPSNVLKNLRDAGRGAEFVAEAVKKSEVEKWRDPYEKENKKKK